MQGKWVRKHFSSRPVQRAFKETHRLLEWPQSVLMVADASAGLSWCLSGINVLAFERKKQADGYTSPNYFQVISQVCKLLVPLSASLLWGGYYRQISCLKHALLPLLCWRMKPFLEHGTSQTKCWHSRICFITSQVLNGKIWLRFAFPVRWNVCMAPRNLFFRRTPTHMN